VAEALVDIEATSREPAALVDAAVRAMERMPRVERGCIVLFHRISATPEFARTIGIPDQDRERVGRESSHGIISGVRETGEERYSEEAAADPECSEYASVQTYQMKTVFCCPIPGCGQEEPRGAIYLENRSQEDAFPGTWRHAVRLLARYLGASLSFLEQRPSNDDPTTEYRREGRFEEMVGASPSMAAVLRSLDTILEGNDARTVLLCGETGVGKDLVAEMLGRYGPRHQGPFVSQNAAALQSTLAESELFGVTRGAYTDATSRPGLFQQASGGILFLNEIAELPLDVQTKLLLVLDTKRVRRLGAQREEEVDVWVIAATNQDLEDAVEQGRFREDLFYRLRERLVWIPPLRQRPEDIPALARHFVGQAAQASKRTLPLLTPDLLHALTSMPWRGNVRELRNTVFQLVQGASSSILTRDSLRGQDRWMARVSHDRDQDTWERTVRRFKRSYLLWAMDEWGPALSQVAKRLGMNRSHIYKLCRKLEIPIVR
jgi:DNA-binding NtrC family response regulator